MRLHVLGRKTFLGPQTEAFVERQMRSELTRFAPMIDDVVVTLGDEAGLPGAPVKNCQVAVHLQRCGSVVADSTNFSYEAAASRAAERAVRSVARRLHRCR